MYMGRRGWFFLAILAFDMLTEKKIVRQQGDFQSHVITRNLVSFEKENWRTAWEVGFVVSLVFLVKYSICYKVYEYFFVASRKPVDISIQQVL